MLQNLMKWVPLHTETWRDAYLLSRLIATKALCIKLCWRTHKCGKGLPSATSEVHIGDGATTVSSLNPSWLQPCLKYICPGGSAPARKPAVQENARQGLHDVQNNEQSCWCKPCCRCAQVQKLQLQLESTNTNPKAPTPEQTSTWMHTIYQQSNSGTLSP